MPVYLGYWNLRGLGQSIRLMLQYADVEYADKLYNFGPAPDFSRSEWLNEKFTLDLDFPNLPFYCDGTNKITQSHAILKHLGRKHNLVGCSEAENIKVDMVEHEALDWRNACSAAVYNPDFENIKEGYISGTVKSKLESLSKFLGNNKWFAGEHLTYVDFILYELFDIHRELAPCSFLGLDNIKNFMDRFEALEPIKKFMTSDKFMKSPIMGPMAGFGAK